jgi:hypothetical protein
MLVQVLIPDFVGTTFWKRVNSITGKTGNSPDRRMKMSADLPIRKLENGATILAQMDDVVLCSWGKEFVTWRIDRELNAYCGHYFNCYDSAKKDFLARV